MANPKQYTVTEKTQVALEALKSELTVAQITSKYEVHATQVNKWKQQAIESIKSGFSGRQKSSDPDQSTLISKLYQQIGQLATECEWLKKKSELFKH